jgi:autotransporter-associated beta strand protein
VLAADNTWINSINLDGFSPANWFSSEVQNDLTPKSIFSDESPETAPSSSTSEQLSSPRLEKDVLFSQLATARKLEPSSREITSAWITQDIESPTAQSIARYSPPGYSGPGIASLVQPAAIAINDGKTTSIQVYPQPQISSASALDPTWIGPSFSSWNDASHWSPATVPNGAGVIADFRPSAANPNQMVTDQDVPGGARLGTLSLAGTAAQTWNVVLFTSLTMDNNGNGAVISNVNTSVGNYMLQISGTASGFLILADNLSITNTSGSTSVNSIQLNTPITGTGNITFHNVSNNLNMGQIFLGPTFAPSTFMGTSTIASGAVVFADENAFGPAGNQVVLGSAGGGDVSLVSTGNAFNFAHPVLVAAGSGGTLVLGTISPSTTTSTIFSGSMMLNGDVALENVFGDAAPTRFTNTISGVGGITKLGFGSVIVSGNNSFTGVTNAQFGPLTASGTNSLGGTSSIIVKSGGTLIFGGSTNNRINDTAPLNLDGMDSGVVSFQTAGLSEHGATNNTAGIGAVTLLSNSIIDLANGASIIAFANSSAQTWTGTLNIYNWSGNLLTGNGTDQVYFGNGITGLTPAQLNSIRFYSDAGSTFLGTANWGLDLDGEIVPTLIPIAIPEPSTWLGGALALGAIGWVARRKFRTALAALL